MNREEARALFHAGKMAPKCPAAVDGAPGDHSKAQASPFVKLPDGNIWRAYACNCGERFVVTVEA